MKKIVSGFIALSVMAGAVLAFFTVASVATVAVSVATSTEASAKRYYRHHTVSYHKPGGGRRHVRYGRRH